MTLQIVPAKQVPFETFTRLLNEAYADYFVPLSIDSFELHQRVIQDDITLDGSVVALLDDVPVGLTMLAHREQRGWVGGVGVLPAYRRQGIARAMMEAVITNARQRGMVSLQLEVITMNDKAQALYDSLGFQKVRLLHIAEGFPRHNPLVTRGDDTKIVEIPVSEALEHYASFHLKPNPWQRERAAIQHLQPLLQAIVTKENDTVTAYVIGVFRPSVIRFVDLGHAPRTAGDLRTLIGHLHREYANSGGSIINIAEDDPAWAVLFVMGYQSELQQFEMLLRL